MTKYHPTQDADLRRAEIETLIGDLSAVGQRFPRIRMVLVEWPPSADGFLPPVIEGPRGYRHPRADRDSPELQLQFALTGVLRVADNLPRPDGRGAYIVVCDLDDPDPAGPVDWLTGGRDRPETWQLLDLFERAGRLVQSMEGPRLLASAEQTHYGWFVALVDICEPDERFTWGRDALRLLGETRPPPVETVVPVERSETPGLQVCYAIHDVIYASKVALRRLLAEGAPDRERETGPAPERATRQAQWLKTKTGWKVSFPYQDGGAADLVLPERKGLADVAKLLLRPNTWIASVDLDDCEDLVSDHALKLCGDDEVRSLRDRLSDLEGTPEGGRSDEAVELRAELVRMLDQRGHIRSVNTDLERVRVRVTKRIGEAIELIRRTLDEELARHLELHIRRGSRCKYGPPSGLNWMVSITEAR